MEGRNLIGLMGNRGLGLDPGLELDKDLDAQTDLVLKVEIDPEEAENPDQFHDHRLKKNTIPVKAE